MAQESSSRSDTFSKTYQFTGVTVKNYRSITSLSLKFEPGKLTTICGPNNVGKTNMLRALDLFFSLDTGKFDPKRDIPYHVYEGSRGGGAKTTITGEFLVTETGRRFTVTAEFSFDEDTGKHVTLTSSNWDPDSSPSPLQRARTRAILRRFRFILIESNNINLPQVISEVFINDVLKGVDRLRKRQTLPLKTLKQFFHQSRDAVREIERALTGHIRSFTEQASGLESKDWKARVVFPEFDTLRAAMSSLVDFTLMDSNDRALDTKGSGVQRVVLLAVMKYVSETSDQPCIWAMDEPEAFLQPGLQKAVFTEFRNLSKSMPIVVTTHSPHFVDMLNLDNTHLFTATEETKIYARRPDQVFIKLSTVVDPKQGAQKIEAIRQHFGLSRNDAWHVTPSNLLVEGIEDKDYLEALATRLGVSLPNVFVAEGADKIPGYLEFLAEFCSDLDYRPYVTCLLDHDSAGRPLKQRLESKAQRGSLPYDLKVKFVFRADGRTGATLDFEIEDWVYPDLMLKGINAILKRKGYKKLLESNWNQRIQKSYINQHVLAFAKQAIQSRNPELDPIDCEAMWFKLSLKQEICPMLLALTDREVADLNARYPATRALLDQLTAPASPPASAAGHVS
jgi:ABC-type transport system involved in cytochrome c biogenesis ATPase subunit